MQTTPPGGLHFSLFNAFHSFCASARDGSLGFHATVLYHLYQGSYFTFNVLTLLLKPMKNLVGLSQ